MVMAVDIERRLPLDWVVTGKGMGETKAREWLLDETITCYPAGRYGLLGYAVYDQPPAFSGPLR